jgi:hypothetical protein
MNALLVATALSIFVNQRPLTSLLCDRPNEKPLPMDVVQSWTKMGADSNWIVVNPDLCVFEYGDPTPGNGGGCVPSFSFLSEDMTPPRKVDLATVRLPESPFALVECCRFDGQSKCLDVGLRAGCKLVRSEVTD